VIDDIAGCRLIVENLANQNEVVGQLLGLFKNVTVDDRRVRPSHGYRAVHLIVDVDGKLVEIQIRTELQQAWAELSEKLSDVFDRSIKYGGGNQDVLSLLVIASEVTMAAEEAIKDKNNVTSEQIRQALTQIKGLIE
jgi:ppGpp synthetase/RelA/SpoT-type nucleotidyltranferase